jgi:putative membrane protein
MQTERRHASIVETERASEYLANERTFLAWIRTSIAVVSLGFVLARFGVRPHSEALTKRGINLISDIIT